MSKHAVLIGVAGGSGAGKSALLRALTLKLGACCLVDLDSYYLDRASVPVNERDAVNYDEPDAFDLPLLLDQLRRLAAGKGISKPRYSFASHTRVGAEPVNPEPTVLIDGLFTLWWPELRALLDMKVFIDVSPDLRLARRLMRDVAERGRTMDSVVAQYLSTVRPMHDRYIEPTRRHADLVVSNDGLPATAVAAVYDAIRSVSHVRPFAG